MKRISPIILIILTTLFLSCELFYEDTTTYGDVYVVSVGIDYANNNNAYTLYGTINDAKELQKAFKLVAEQANKTFFGYLMIQEGSSTTQATFDDPAYPSWTNIKATLTSIKDSASEHDLTIFTFSGHGLDKRGDLLLAHESTNGSPSTQGILLSPEDLLEEISKIPGRKLIIIDSCYSGLLVEEGSSSLSTHYYKRIDQWFEKYFDAMEYTKPTLMMLTAAAAHDSYEVDIQTNHRHGVFTEALLRALGWFHPHTPEHTSVDIQALNNNRLTVDSLFSYIKKNQILPTHWSLFSDTKFQHPTTTGGPLDMVLLQF